MQRAIRQSKMRSAEYAEAEHFFGDILYRPEYKDRAFEFNGVAIHSELPSAKSKGKNKKKNKPKPRLIDIEERFYLLEKHHGDEIDFDPIAHWYEQSSKIFRCG